MTRDEQKLKVELSWSNYIYYEKGSINDTDKRKRMSLDDVTKKNYFKAPFPKYIIEAIGYSQFCTSVIFWNIYKYKYIYIYT